MGSCSHQLNYFKSSEELPQTQSATDLRVLRNKLVNNETGQTECSLLKMLPQEALIAHVA